MLSDDEAAVFDRLVGDLESDHAFTERIARPRRPVNGLAVYLAVAVVALIGSVLVLGGPYGPVLAFGCWLVSLGSAARLTASAGWVDVRAGVRGRLDRGRMALRNRPSR